MEDLLASRGFRSLIPADTSNWAFLPHLQDAEISLNKFRHRLGARSKIYPDPKLYFEILRHDTGWTGEMDKFFMQFADDVLDVLCDAPLKDLHIELPTHEICHIDWRTAFTPFNQLRYLSVCGTGSERGHSGAAALYKGLNPYLTPGAGIGGEVVEYLVLLKLQSLQIESFDRDDVLERALTNRMNFLGTPGSEALDKLYFVLSNDGQPEEDIEERRAVYQELFQSCVKKLTYEPKEPDWY
ncbi:hypothetical protein TRAPUB_8315 [Trametes pubescens]|uniref:Uncharacterized protein n=1 Tax=Trametes pubescens TaxID=154538 RepID=A0A1M2W5R2_TRAPU|nr:hypothetical protein TRAPUB_8315 [Trametes pubescens]